MRRGADWVRRPSVGPLVLAAVLPAVLAAVLVGCTSVDPSPEAGPTDQAQSSPGGDATVPVELSVLVFNVEYGGTQASDAAIADLDADMVGVLESYNRLPEIAEAAGYPYYNVGLQLLSKHPIWEPSGADGLYAFIEVRPGEAVAMVNTHLDYVRDGPNRLESGVPLDDVLATEREVRLSSIQKLLPSVTRLLADGWPVLLTGDLNQPSHLDWTAETASRHGGFGPVAWPVSRAMVDAGLRDSYREAHPDPVVDPGDTWGGVAGGRGSPRRIDYVYVGGEVEVLDSQLVGERGGPGVDRLYERWPSDHRAVLSTLRVSPMSLPPTASLSSRMLTAGDELTVGYRLPEEAAPGEIVMTGPATSRREADGASGTLTVATDDLAPGDYHVELLDDAGDVVADNRLSLRAPGARVSLKTDARRYRAGTPVTVTWTDGPANRWDWVAVYRRGDADPERDDYLVWGYTGGHDAGALPPSTRGRLVLGREHQGRPWPLPPGRYVVHYLLTDQYVTAGSATFAVVDGG